MRAIDRTAALPSLHLQVSRQQQRRVEAKRGGLGFHGFQLPIIANRVISPVDCADQHAVPPRRRKATATTTLQKLFEEMEVGVGYLDQDPIKNVFAFGDSTECTDGFI
jgi:hypothetical protein